MNDNYLHLCKLKMKESLMDINEDINNILIVGRINVSLLYFPDRCVGRIIPPADSQNDQIIRVIILYLVSSSKNSKRLSMISKRK